MMAVRQGHLACPLLVDVVTEQALRLTEPWPWLLVNGQRFLFGRADSPGRTQSRGVLLPSALWVPFPAEPRAAPCLPWGA